MSSSKSNVKLTRPEAKRGEGKENEKERKRGGRNKAITPEIRVLAEKADNFLGVLMDYLDANLKSVNLTPVLRRQFFKKTVSARVFGDIIIVVII